MHKLVVIAFLLLRKIKMNTTRCILLCLLYTIAPCLGQTLLLEGSRVPDQTSNSLQLLCITAATDQPNADAVFLLNGTRLEEVEGLLPLRTDNGVRIEITRGTEGGYSCFLPSNPDNVSPSRDFVAVPNFVFPSTRTFFTEVGQTATVDCPISPGRLVQQYFVTWRNGSDTSQVYGEILAPSVRSNPTPPPTETRYSVDPDTFSLMISDARLSDSDSSYQCVLGVEDPLQLTTMLVYEFTRSVNQSLIVYKPPIIKTPPTDAIISLQNTLQVQFNCTAIGDPAPEISWRHNGIATTDPLMYHVNQFTPVPDPRGRGFTRTGTLSIFPLNEGDSGWVECVAGVVSSEGSTGQQLGGAVVPQDMQAARLSVLGRFQRMDVLITQEGDIIYKLFLRGVINTPVALLISYSEVDNDDDDEGLTGAVRNDTTIANYNNTEVITHIEFNSMVPFKKFRVGVALMSTNIDNQVVGPINTGQEAFDISKPSIVPVGVMALKIATAAAVPSAITLFILLTVIVVICTVVRHRRKTAKERFRNNIAKRTVEVVQVLAESDISDDKSDKLLEFAERIISRTCESCHLQGVGQGEGQGHDEPDGGPVGNGHAMSNFNEGRKRMSSQLMQMTVKMVQTGLRNRMFGDELRMKVTEVMSDNKCRPTEGATPTSNGTGLVLQRFTSTTSYVESNA